MAEPAIAFTVTIAGERQIARVLTRIGSRVSDLREPFSGMADDFFGNIEPEQFATEGSRGGEAWPPLAESTLRRKPPGLPILVRTGALRASFAGGAESVRKLGRRSMEIGTSVSYAAFHQTGAGPTPRRRPIHLTSDDGTRWAKLIQRHAFARGPL